MQCYFINYGDVGATVTKFWLESLWTPYFNAEDINYYPKNLYIPAGGSLLHTFTVNDYHCPQVGDVDGDVKGVITWH